MNRINKIMNILCCGLTEGAENMAGQSPESDRNESGDFDGSGDADKQESEGGSMLTAYLTAALWSSLDGDGLPLDRDYDIEDIAEESYKKASSDCEKFKKMAGALLDGLEMEEVGHDFWLTRAGHGAGFWDGDYEEDVGEKLTNISKKFPEVYPVVGNKGKIYFE